MSLQIQKQNIANIPESGNMSPRSNHDGNF